MSAPRDLIGDITLHDVGIIAAKMLVGGYSVVGRALVLLVVALAVLDFVGLTIGILPPWTLVASLGVLAITEYVMYLLVRMVEKDISLNWGELQEGCCPACGYDMRGTLAADRDVCPECGQRLAHRPDTVRPLR